MPEAVRFAGIEDPRPIQQVNTTLGPSLTILGDLKVTTAFV